MEKTRFMNLAAVDVNEHLDKKTTGKTTLSYLSWAWAWDYFKKACPDAKYEIRHWNDRPYLFDKKTGYMVETSVTAAGETHTMWLPVMDSANHAMLDRPYTIKTKFDTFDVPAATMFDINKTIMRCLVKNMAMFGLGLYIYAGEDLPADADDVPQVSKQPVKPKKTIDDKIPFAEPVTPAPRVAGPDDWLTIGAFQGIAEQCNDLIELQRIVNEQRDNPRIKELITIAAERKRAILDNLQQQGA